MEFHTSILANCQVCYCCLFFVWFYMYLLCYRRTLLLFKSVLHVFQTQLAKQLNFENLPVRSLDARRPQ